MKLDGKTIYAQSSDIKSRTYNVMISVIEKGWASFILGTLYAIGRQHKEKKL